MSMPSVFVDPMLQAMSTFLAQGAIPTAWALGVRNPIPKDQGAISINTLRPLCLQNVIFKWASATILLMMEDIVSFATPPPPTESLHQALVNFRPHLERAGSLGSDGPWGFSLSRFLQGV